MRFGHGCHQRKGVLPRKALKCSCSKSRPSPSQARSQQAMAMHTLFSIPSLHYSMQVNASLRGLVMSPRNPHIETQWSVPQPCDLVQRRYRIQLLMTPNFSFHNTLFKTLWASLHISIQQELSGCLGATHRESGSLQLVTLWFSADIENNHEFFFGQLRSQRII